MNQSVTKKIPKLRFPEFTDEWDEKKLGDIGEVKRGAPSQHLKYVNDEHEGIRLLRINDFLSNSPVFVKDTHEMKRFRVRTNDLLIAGTGATAGITFIIPASYNNFAYSYNAPRIRIDIGNVFFVYLYLKSDSILKQQKSYFVGNAQHFLDTDVIRSFRLYYPSLDEQQKIASFLSSIDEWIENLREQKNVLEKYKKGMVQKIFSQEIRFKDENGNDFPEWKEKRLGELVYFQNGKPNEENVIENGEFNLITIDSIDLNGNLKQMHKRSSKNDSSLVKGDLVMVLSDIAHGKLLGLTDIIPDNNYVLNQRMGRLRLKDKNSSEFLRIFINKKQNFFRKRGQGTSQRHIYERDVNDLQIILPSFEEQEKIAEFLSLLDQQIEAKENQIKKAEEWKKGLLQQMFV